MTLPHYYLKDLYNSVYIVYILRVHFKYTSRTHCADNTFRIVLLEAQLDAARSQALHYEAKLTVTADYEHVKNSLISMESERKQLLVGNYGSFGRNPPL